MYLSVIGNIGSGKTYWCSELKKRFPFAKLFTEPIEPLIKTGLFNAYYENPIDNAFAFQLGMIYNRYHLYAEIQKGSHYIEDGSYEIDANVFAIMHNTFDNPFYKTIYANCKKIFESINILYIYIDRKPKKCMELIKKRARDAEMMNLGMDTLRKVHINIRKFLKTHKHVVFNPDKEEISSLLEKINEYNFH